MSTIPYAKAKKKNLSYNLENLKCYNLLKKVSLWHVGLAEFAVVLLIGSRMSEIIPASVHSGKD